ncbi:MAG: beta-lactamase family protein [Acetobacteraceae bacterium]|nr:beta-lactamase family protein [Acetobacteraceae bacterium]
MSAPDPGAAGAAADAAVAPWRAENGPGGAIVLFDRRRILFEACGGLADLAHGLAFTPDTANRWASMSKHVFASLLLKRGIALDATLGSLLPGCSEAVGGANVGRLLDMTSGLPDLADYFAGLGISAATPMRRDALAAMARTLPALNYPQGSEISYTNTGYRLLQEVVEAGAPPLDQQWRETFFDPLRLDVTFPHDFTVPVAHLANGYWQDDAGWHAGQYGLHISASGGLAGSARTLARWLMALLAAEAPVEGLLEQLAARRTLVHGAPTFYALGIAHAPWLGQECFGQGGSLPGYKDHFLLAPRAGIGVVVLSNREETDSLGLALSVMAAWLGVALPPPAPDALPEGLFADAEGGPFWAEHKAGRFSFQGAEEPLFQEGPTIAVTRSPYMSMRLARQGERIVGDINGAERRLAPVPEGLAADASWAGVWRNAAHGAELVVEVSQGGAQATLGTAPARLAMQLRPLGHGRALGDAWDNPWRRRPCFVFRGDRLTLVSSRSRVLEYARA